MDIEFTEISKEDLKNKFFIVKLGNKDRPATEEDIKYFQDALGKVFDLMELDFEPTILVTNHAISLSKYSKEETKKTINKIINNCLEIDKE